MQYMIVGTMKGVAPEVMSKVSEKWNSWQPPAGLKVEGSWYDGGSTSFNLVSADDYSLVAEYLTQFSGIQTYAVHPVASGNDAKLQAAVTRGLEFAAK